jgi:tetratricopeptide (TPR) repeat protein
MAETQFNFDVFLSHSSKDKPAVETIARLLRDEHQIKAWLDKWNLVPGEAWQDALEDALDDSQTFAVFLGPSGIGPWENEEMRSAIEDRVQDKSRRVIPVLLPGAPDNKDLKIPRFLRRATWVDFRSGLDDKEALYRLFCGITGQAPGDRGASTTNSGTPANWFLKHRYGLPADFTGRVAEREFLTQWLAGNGEQPLLVLRALGGFGKSALTWYWLLHDVDRSKWSRVVWWGFYDDNNFETFLKDTLEYLKVDVPQSPRLQVDALLREMERQNVLLVMDGFERALRAFSGLGAAYQLDGGSADEGRDLDCVSTVAEEFLRGFASSGGLMQGRVLMTTRLTPRVLYVGANHAAPLHGMLEKELTQMHPADAVAFFQKQEVRGTDQDIERACAAYGFHPLSLRLLAGLIVKDKRQPLDIRAAERYAQKVSADAKQRQHHVLEQSYAGLAPAGKALLGRLACFRSSVTYDTLAEITKDDPLAARLDETLDDLATRGLVHCSLVSKPDSLIPNSQSLIYDLHPIVRRYAYDRLTAPERTGVHAVLIVYFDAVPKPQKVETLEDLDPVIELYHHTVRAGKLDEARVLFRDRLQKAIYFQFGAYQLQIELLRALFLDGEDKPPRLKEESDQAIILNDLGMAYARIGQPKPSITLREMQIAIRERQGIKKSIAIGLGNVATQQLVIGALSAAERNLRRSIDLCREISESSKEAHDHSELIQVLAYCGMWNEFENESKQALEMCKEQNDIQAQGIIWSYHALHFLLMAREAIGSNQSSIVNLKSAIECAQRALELAGETTRTRMNVPRDYIRAYWLLGAAYRTNNDLTLAEENLSKALNLCRQINMVDHEANILLDLARLSFAYGLSSSAQDRLQHFQDAQEKASEALMITERSGYVLQGSDVNLFLAQYALEQEKDKAKAKEYAESALRLATCDGPPYYYKVAYEEAERMLEMMNEK